MTFGGYDFEDGDFGSYMDQWQQSQNWDFMNDPQFNPDYEGVASQFDPSGGATWQQYMTQNMPTGSSQFWSSMMADYMNALNAQKIQQNFFGEALGNLENLQAEFPGLAQGIIDDYSTGFADLLSQQKEALGQFSEGSASSLENMMQILADLSEQRAGTTDEMRELGDLSIQRGEDLARGARQRQRGRDRRLNQRISDIDTQADAMIAEGDALAADVTRRTDEAGEGLKQANRAHIQAMSAALNDRTVAEESAIDLSDAPPEVKAAMKAELNMSNRQQVQGMVGQANQKFIDDAYRADIMGAEAVKFQAGLKQSGAQLVGGLDQAAASIAASAAQTAGMFDAQVTGLEFESFKHGMGLKVQAALTDFQAQMQEAGMGLQIEQARIDNEKFKLAQEQWLMGAAASNLDAVANMELQALRDQYAGDWEVERMRAGAGALFNPISINALFSEQHAYMMSLYAAGLNPTTYGGLDVGSIASGEAPSGTQYLT